MPWTDAPMNKVCCAFAPLLHAQQLPSLGDKWRSTTTNSRSSTPIVLCPAVCPNSLLARLP